jgi:hypothetical protein
MPKKALLEMLQYLRDNDAQITIKTGVQRGYFGTSSNKKKFEIGLSAKDTDSLASPIIEGEEPYADTAIHEFFHFIQKINPKVTTLEHAWLYGRSVQTNAQGEEVIPAPVSFTFEKSKLDDVTVPKLEKYKSTSEIVVPIQNLPSPYVGRIYTTETNNNDRVSLHPTKSNGTEVMTVGSQVFFTPQYIESTREGGPVGIVKSKTKNTYDSRLRHGQNGYYNPADGNWYKDSAFTIPLTLDAPDEEIFATVGTSTRDDNYLAFVLGMIVGLS